MNTLKKHAVEVIATVWLAVVVVQYLSRYFIGGPVPDLVPAYLVMLILILSAVGLRIVKRTK